MVFVSARQLTSVLTRGGLAMTLDHYHRARSVLALEQQTKDRAASKTIPSAQAS